MSIQETTPLISKPINSDPAEITINWNDHEVKEVTQRSLCSKKVKDCLFIGFCLAIVALVVGMFKGIDFCTQHPSSENEICVRLNSNDSFAPVTSGLPLWN